jgi:hypothetical protein
MNLAKNNAYLRELLFEALTYLERPQRYPLSKYTQYQIVEKIRKVLK